MKSNYQSTLLKSYRNNRFRFAVLFLFLFFNSQIFAFTSSNPMGLKGFQEGYYVALLLFSSLYLFSQFHSSRGFVYKSDLTVVLLVTLLMSYSAFAAHVRFGQPIMYGLIEERRIFSILIYFPIIWALRNRCVNIYEVFSIITLTAFICLILTFLVQFGIISKITVQDYSTGALRQERYGIGQHYIAIALLYSVFLYLNGIDTNLQIIKVLSLFLVLVTVVQTRQIVLAVFIGSMIMSLRLSVRLLVRMLCLSAILVAIITVYYSNNPSQFDTALILFSELRNHEYLTESARAVGYSIVYAELIAGNIWGNGSLSLLWKNGFSRIYGDYFFLADIGVVGSFFKFGLLAIIIYLAFYLTIFSKCFSARKSESFKLTLGVISYLTITAPVAAPLEYRGFIAGLVMAVVIFISSKETKI